MVNRGFFSLQTIQKEPISLIPKCGSCGLYRTCNSPKMPWSGEGKKSILIVAEAPSQAEDDAGIHLCGATGRHLESVLRSLGVDMRRDCWLTNAIICKPKGDPDSKQIDWCRPNLTNTIKELNPNVIIPLGGIAIQSLIGQLWKEDIGKVGRWLGWKIPNQNPNTWICPNWHPSYVYHLTKEERKKPESTVVTRLFAKYLQAAIQLKDRPWKKPPEMERRVIVELNPKKAAEHIMMFTEASEGRSVAFDLETNMLRPDSTKAQIVCCSISDGRLSVAFPWMGPAIRAMRNFIRSKVPKVGHNLKFEERWMRKEFGHGVRNWDWDGMLAAHWMDNRSGITGLKFQSYVHMGVTDYASHISPFLRASGANVPNRIKEVPIENLLRYCGMDSLLEARLASIQKRSVEYVSVIQEKRRSSCYPSWR